MSEADKRKRIPMKLGNRNSELAYIFKAKLDKFGYSTWEEFTSKVGVDNKRAFIDFFNGKQCLSRETLEKAFELLEITPTLLDIYTEKIVIEKYKIK